MTNKYRLHIGRVAACMTAALATLMLAGCASPLGGGVRLSREEYLAIADEAATAFLKRFNQTDIAKRHGGPFFLHEYDRKISEAVDPSCKRASMRARYTLQRKVDFEGQPREFTVWILKGTRQARISGGPS